MIFISSESSLAWNQPSWNQECWVHCECHVNVLAVLWREIKCVYGPSFISPEFFSPLIPQPWFLFVAEQHQNNHDNNSSLRPNCQKPRMKKTTPSPQSSSVPLGFLCQERFTYFLRSQVAVGRVFPGNTEKVPASLMFSLSESGTFFPFLFERFPPQPQTKSRQVGLLPGVSLSPLREFRVPLRQHNFGLDCGFHCDSFYWQTTCWMTQEDVLCSIIQSQRPKVEGKLPFFPCRLPIEGLSSWIFELLGSWLCTSPLVFECEVCGSAPSRFGPSVNLSELQIAPLYDGSSHACPACLIK